MKLDIIARKTEGISKAAPVLFVHGAWHTASCWEEYFLPYFAAKGFDAYAFSLRGHGNSGKVNFFRFTRISHYIEDLSQIVEQMPCPPILVGHSMGGLVVQKYLETHNAPAAILLAPVPVGGVWRTTLRILLRHFFVFVRANLTMSLWPFVSTKTRAREMFFSQDMSREDVSRYYNQLQNESYFAFLGMLITSLPKPKKVTVKPLIIGAENDFVFTLKVIKKTASAYKVKPEILPETAHDIMLEKSWQKAADIMIEWILSKKL